MSIFLINLKDKGKRHSAIINVPGLVPVDDSGDARLRRERLAPKCEPIGAELEKSAQKIKSQSHFLRRYAPRCLIRSRE